MTDTSEKNDIEKTVVNVPVTVVIKVPIEIDVAIDREHMEEAPELGCMVVDPNSCKQAATRALVIAQQDETVGKAFEGLVAAAMRFQEQNPQVEIYMTPFAGLVPESKM